MNAAFVQWVDRIVPGITGMAIEIAWKAAILCLAVWVVHLLAGRHRLLLRSTVWHLCLVGLVVLPLTIAALPRWHFETQFANTVNESSRQAVAELKSHEAVDAVSKTERLDASETAAEFDAAIVDASAEMARIPAGDDIGAAAPATSFVHLGELAVLAAVTVYFLTLTVLLIRLAASLAGVTALLRQSTPVVKSDWLDALGRWKSQFGLRSNVQLMQASAVDAPVVVRWRQPVILLPPRLAETTDRQTIDAVLLHELTHAARGDYAWNLLLRVVRAIYWPHPCVWLVGYMVRQVREEVCDAVCIRWMRDVRAYCGILLEMASSLVRRSEVVLGMAMSNSSRLGRRIERVENNPGLDRGLLGRPARTALAALILAAVGFVGSAQLASRVSAAGQDQKADAIDSKAAEKPVNQTQPKQPSVPITADANAAEVALQDSKESKTSKASTIKVERGKLEKTTIQTATLEAFGQISVHSRNAGIVSKAKVEVGDQVKLGEVLAEMDVPDLDAELSEKEAALAQAEADEEQRNATVETAQAAIRAHAANGALVKAESERATATEKLRKRQFERFKELVNSKSIDERLLDEKEEQLLSAEAETRAAAAKIQTSSAALDQSRVEVRLAEANLKAARLRAASAKADLAKSRAKSTDGFRLIRSPIDGVVVEKNIEPDMTVKRSDDKPLFRIASSGFITAVVLLPEPKGLMVKRDNRASVRFFAFDPPRVIAGKVSRVAYKIDTKTGTFRTEIVLPNAEDFLRPGMHGDATIVVGEIADVLSVPHSVFSSVTQTRNGETATCDRIVDGQAIKTTVKLGQSNGERTVITEGLSEGDVILVQPQNVAPPAR